ncbi:MAG: SDR family oxidoreductase [bacterium]|nr:SDR family oxidoreductase [bacterium]
MLTGATGFVGSHILAELRQRGHEVRAVARRPEDQPQTSGVEWVRGDFTSLLSVELWQPYLVDVDAVVNAVGIIREAGGLRFEELHAQAPMALFEAARMRGVPRVVQISAAGVRPGTPFEYFSSKSRADDALLKGGAGGALVLRPSLIYGRDGQSAQLFRSLASLPVIPLVGDGSSSFRPLLVEDLAVLVANALESEAMPEGVFEVGGADALTLRELLLAVRAWLNAESDPAARSWRHGPTISVPLPLVRLAARAGDITGIGPLDSDMLGMLIESRAADIAPLRSAFAFMPRGLRKHFQEHPSSEPERWHTRLKMVRVPLRILVASIWIITPVVSLARWDFSIGLLRDSGLPEAILPVLLCLSCALEVLVAAAILVRFRVTGVGILQLAMIGFYTVFLSATSPELWLDPFGPLSKNLPLIGAVLVLMALDE